ncbi:MAG TPA: insulinase family protein, partial [Paracoccaceae bacterium]|nr:insulinase family protein [Paracoccaceae bacterium]
PAKFIGGEKRVVKDLEQAHFTFSLETPGFRSPDIYAAQIFASAMGGGMSSRLFQEAREKKGMCYTIFAQAGAHDDTGATTIYAGTAADQIKGLAELTVDELRKAADDMSDAEVERARAQMKAGMLMGLESPSSRAERMARMIGIWGRVPTLEEVVAKIDAVSTANVRDYAAKLCENGIPAMAIYGPVDATPEIGELARRLAA